VPLILETGAGVALANSYVSLADYRDYASERGAVLPASDLVCLAQLYAGFDVIEANRARYQGQKATSAQGGQFPREGLTIDGFAVPANVIPIEVIRAQMHAALASNAGVDLFPATDGKTIIKEKVDVIETTYSDTGASDKPKLTAVDALLSSLFKTAGFSLTTIRV
jgi:hypothetical protein